MKYAHAEPTLREQVERARKAWELRDSEREGGQLRLESGNLQGEKENLQLTLDTAEGSC